MNKRQMTKDLVIFQKAAFDNACYALSLWQDQTARLVRCFLEKAPWFAEDGKEIIAEWVMRYKQNRGAFKAYADANYRKAIAYCGEPEGAAKQENKNENRA